MNPDIIQNTGTLVWSGEHWINAIRDGGSDAPVTWVSLFHTRYSAAGEGNAAHVIVPGDNGINAVFTDHPALA